MLFMRTIAWAWALFSMFLLLYLLYQGRHTLCTLFTLFVYFPRSLLLSISVVCLLACFLSFSKIYIIRVCLTACFFIVCVSVYVCFPFHILFTSHLFITNTKECTYHPSVVNIRKLINDEKTCTHNNCTTNCSKSKWTILPYLKLKCISTLQI